MTLFSIISFTIYIAWMLGYLRAWLKIRPPFLVPAELNMVTIIIPARNEARKIALLLRQVCTQRYDASHVEVVLADDHSDDDTAVIVQSLMREFPQLKYIKLESGRGKKAAISAAIAHSTGELIITLDADVDIGPNWLSTIVAFHAANHFDMILLPVMFKDNKTTFGAFQVLEFASLVGTSAAAAALQSPVMCNGANLAFTRKVFNQHSGYQGNEQYAGGDDMFLMMKIKAANPASVGYLHREEAIAHTHPCKNLRDFIVQRIRWSSKTSGYTDRQVILLAIVVWCANLAVVFQFISFFSLQIPSTALLSLMILKWLVDFFFISSVTWFYRMNHLLKYYPILMVLYPFYIVITPILALIYQPMWKGRKVIQNNLDGVHP